MKKVLLIFFYCLLVANFLHSQYVNWPWAIGSAGNNEQQVMGCASDRYGNLYCAGWFKGGNIIFGNSNLLNPHIGHSAFFVVKLTPSGQVLWAKVGESPYGNSASSIATDSSGDAYLAGTFNGSVAVFDSLTLSAVDSNNSNDFIAKYDGAGNIVWAKISNGNIDNIAVDEVGDAFVTGAFQTDSINFDGVTIFQSHNIYGEEDFFIAKYSSSGNVLWAKSATLPVVNGINSSAAGDGLAIDKSGNVYATGYFSATYMTFDTITIYNKGDGYTSDFFIVKFDPLGNVAWAKRAGGYGDDVSSGIATDHIGNVYITGNYESGVIYFGSDSLVKDTPTVSFYVTDFFIAKYDESGKLLWVKGAGGNSYEAGCGVAKDLLNNVYVCGSFLSHEFTYDSVSLLPPTIYQDPLFVLKLDSNGTVKCGGSLPSGQRFPSFISAGQDGSALITGSFSMDPFVVGADTFVQNATSNVFIAKFECQETVDVGTLTANATVLQLHPNPFTTQATVQYSLPVGSKNAALIIYDLLGRERSSYQLNSTNGEIAINARNLSSGVYLYSLVVDDRVVVTKKMVVSE